MTDCVLLQMDAGWSVSQTLDTLKPAISQCNLALAARLGSQ